MKKYEILELDIQNIALTDVITTSADVTTEEIPWPTGSTLSDGSYELAAVNASAFKLY